MLQHQSIITQMIIKHIDLAGLEAEHTQAAQLKPPQTPLLTPKVS